MNPAYELSPLPRNEDSDSFDEDSFADVKEKVVIGKLKRFHFQGDQRRKIHIHANFKKFHDKVIRNLTPEKYLLNRLMSKN